MSRETDNAVAEGLFAVCDEGVGAVLDAERPLASLYDTAVSHRLGWAHAARSAIGAFSESNAFLAVRERAASVESGFAGWSAEVDGKRMPQACIAALEDDEFLWCLGHLVRELKDAGDLSVDGENLAALADKAFDARERALELLAEIG